MCKFVDIHTHSLQDTDNKEIIKINSVDIVHSRDIDAISFCSLGIHPWSVNNESDNTHEMCFLEKKIHEKNVLAVGESGLDRVHNHTFFQQIKIFERLIDISEKSKKPLIIHSVRAYSDIISLRKRTKATMPWILHAFNANEQIVKQLLRYDFYFSLGELLFKNEDKASRLLRIIPLERLFLETDASDYKITEVYDKTSYLLNIDPDKLRNNIFCNFEKIFTIK